MASQRPTTRRITSVMSFLKGRTPEAQYRVAGCHAATGDKEAAIRTLKTVCKVHQDLSLTCGVDVIIGGAAKKDEK